MGGDVLSVWSVGKDKNKKIITNDVINTLFRRPSTSGGASTTQPINLRLEHLAVYLDESLLFEKVGGGGDKPFRITNLHGIEKAFLGGDFSTQYYEKEIKEGERISMVHRPYKKDDPGTFAGFMPDFTTRFSVGASPKSPQKRLLSSLRDVFSDKELMEIGVTVHDSIDVTEEIQDGDGDSDGDKGERLLQEKKKKGGVVKQGIGLQKAKKYSLFVADTDNSSDSPVVAATAETHDPEDYDLASSIVNQVGGRPIYG